MKVMDQIKTVMEQDEMIYGCNILDITDMPVSQGDSDGVAIKIGNILEFEDIHFGISNFVIIFDEALGSR